MNTMYITIYVINFNKKLLGVYIYIYIYFPFYKYFIFFNNTLLLFTYINFLIKYNNIKFIILIKTILPHLKLYDRILYYLLFKMPLTILCNNKKNNLFF